MTYIMALDQGTSSSRAIIYNERGESVQIAQHRFDMYFPADGWVEQDPEVLWQTTLKAGRDAIAQAGIDPAQLKSYYDRVRLLFVLNASTKQSKSLNNESQPRRRRRHDDGMTMTTCTLGPARDLGATPHRPRLPLRPRNAEATRLASTKGWLPVLAGP